MEKICCNCKRTLGLFSGENRIHPKSTNYMCDRCYSPFGTAANRIKALQNIPEIQEAYNDAIRLVQRSSLVEKTLITNELEVLYQNRIAELDFIKKQQQQEAIRLEKKKEAEANRLKREQEEEAKRLVYELYLDEHYDELAKSFLMTTGNDFSGYEITDYLGIVSEGAVQGTGWLSELSADINDIIGTESNTFAHKMRMCREAALQKAKDTAIRKGANALVSIDFETMTFRNNMIGIMVAGTAVKIKKTAG